MVQRKSKVLPKITKRTVPVVPESLKLRYQKMTGGIHYLGDGTKVVKNQIITVYPEQIAETFKADFKCLDVDPSGKDVGLKIGLQPIGDKFNIINIKTGEVINKGKPLTPAQAKIFMGEEPLPEEDEDLDKDPDKDPEEDPEDEEDEFDD